MALPQVYPRRVDNEKSFFSVPAVWKNIKSRSGYVAAAAEIPLLCWKH
jgi:hypothetical protein